MGKERDWSKVCLKMGCTECDCAAGASTEERELKNLADLEARDAKAAADAAAAKPA